MIARKTDASLLNLNLLLNILNCEQKKIENSITSKGRWKWQGGNMH